MHWIEKAQDILDNKEAQEHEGMLLDITTASMLIQVHNNLNKLNQKKFRSLSLFRAVNIGWKVCA